MEINKCLGCMEDFRGYPCPNCGYDPEKADGLEFMLPPKTILYGKYLVGKVLGQGGFGITYVGWDLALERKVAIKEYFPTGQVGRTPGTRTLTWYTSAGSLQARKDGMEMFLKEARKMAKVDNIPGVVKVRDLFRENDTAYIVMDFVEGETLKARLKRNGPLSWDQAKEIFLPAIRSMERVHQAGLVHRDLSPDNLMLTPDGQVMVLDLGAAKDLNINSGASSMQVAKSGFSPLEQYTQRGGSGPWTDVYAMAATVYYSLTGTLPPNAVDRMEEDTLSFDHPGLAPLPEQAKEALKNALVLSPKKRTQSMAELEEGLYGEAKPEPEPKPTPEFKPEPKPEPKPESKPEFQPKPVSKREAAPARKPAKSKIWIVAAVIAVCAAIGIYAKVIKHSNDYQNAQALMDAEEYEEVTKAFDASENYQDTSVTNEELALQTAYEQAQTLMSNGKYSEAAEAFAALGNYRDSADQAEKANQAEKTAQEAYQQALRLLEDKRYPAAIIAFTKLGDYRDSAQQAEAARGVQQAVTIAAGGDHTVALHSDGTVLAVGYKKFGQCDVENWRDIVAVTAGTFHTVGLRSDGTVVAVGHNKEGQCDVGSWRDIVAVAAGSWHTVGLRSDGTVVAVGDNKEGQCDVSSWRDIVAVSADAYHTVGLRSDGTVVAAGSNENGKCEVGNWRNIVAVSAGTSHTVGLCSDGTVVAVGHNGYGRCEVSSWRDIVAVSAGDSHTVGLCSDGTVMAVGRNEDGECEVGGWRDIVAVAIGDSHMVGLRGNGTMVAVGSKEWGKFDVGGWTNIATP